MELGKVDIKPGFLEQRPPDGAEDVGRRPPAREMAAERQSRTSGKTINRQGLRVAWGPRRSIKWAGQEPATSVRETNNRLEPSRLGLNVGVCANVGRR
jgi:hypothetical protein